MKKLSAALALGVMAAVAPEMPAHAQCADPTAFAEFGGGVVAVRPIRTGWVAVGRGRTLETVRIGSDGAPAGVHASNVVANQIRQVQGIADTAYVNDGASVYAFTRLTAATSPVQLASRFDAPDGPIASMFTVGNIVYVLGEWGFLWAVDFTDPSAPVLRSTLALGIGRAYDMTYSDSKLYITRGVIDEVARISVIDISSPDSPTPVRVLDFPGTPAWEQISASRLIGLTRLFVSAGSRLQVVDVPDAINLPYQLRGSRDHIIMSTICEIAGAYVMGDNWILKYDFLDPALTTTVDSRWDQESNFVGFSSLTSNGVTRHFAAGSEGGLSVLDTDLDLVARSHEPWTGNARRVVLQSPGAPSSYAYIADGYGGMKSVNVAGDSVTVSGEANYTGFVNDIAINGNLVWMTDTRHRGVYCYDVSQPALPVFRNSYVPQIGTCTQLANAGNRVVVALDPPGGNERPQMLLVDFTSPSAVVQAQVQTPSVHDVVRVVVRDGIAYTLQTNRLVTYVIGTDSLTVRNIVAIDTAPLEDIALFGRYACIIGGSTLSVMDVGGGPLSLVGQFPLEEPGRAIATAGNWMAIGGDSGIAFYDVSTPSLPIRIAAGGLPAPARGIAGGVLDAEPTFIVAGGNSGALAFHPPPDFAPVLVEGPDSAYVCQGTAEFTVDVRFSSSPDNPTRFQWQRVRGGQASDLPGATQPTLTLNGVTAEDTEWRYRVIAWNDCGQVISEAAGLILCRADFNCDTFANSQDFFDFLSAFFASGPSADVNGDGGVNSQDFFDFLVEFFEGCPV